MVSHATGNRCGAATCAGSSAWIAEGPSCSNAPRRWRKIAGYRWWFAGGPQVAPTCGCASPSSRRCSSG